ncbi:hypothetical protein [Morganella morganii]|uniref:phage tail fiber protein n=1 Tax=Morganella morganii TaxID=582 RepID=UPI0023675A35|nr:hypothetical protein [Morganella morganii]
MIYTDGTIATKAGSPIVTSTGTQWKKNIHGVAPGQLISIENGTTPVSMMIRAVNSDTELVLAFNAPVTLSGAKYSIATTVPDGISDAARTMSANQGYIVYFLQAMEQWMTDTGKVEIELPNGQKVTLDSIKALNAELAKKVDSDKLGTAAGKDVGTSVGNVMGVGAFGIGGQREVVNYLPDLNDINFGNGTISVFNTETKGTLPFTYGYVHALSGSSATGLIQVAYQISTGRNINLAVRDYLLGSWGPWVHFYNTKNTTTDSNGFIKQASPIIEIFPDGHYETNDESEGAEVSRTGTGQYHITGILGYNSDGAWGVNGGISVPKDNNGLELVYVDDRVQEDGSLIIETCHRQHAHLPERFQNWRLKEITPEGERIFYQDGEPCDLPESTRLDVRVEMPQGSVWNVKQRELAEQMECEQAEHEETH